MSDTPSGDFSRLVSPLQHARCTAARARTASVTVAEYPNLGYLVIRGRQDDAAFMAAVEGVIGSGLPVRPRAVSRCPAGVVLWQSPDEWWLVCARHHRDALVHALEHALTGCFSQVVDTSGGLTALNLAGRDGSTVLRHLSPYDFDGLADGECVSTVIGKASFTVLRTPTGGVTLVFRRSFAQYIWDLLDRAALPYGMRRVEAREAPDGLLSPLLDAAMPWEAPAALPELAAA